LAFLASALLAAAAEEGPQRPLRILVADERETSNLAVKGPYKIRILNSEEGVMSGNYLYAVIRPDAGGLVIGKRSVASRGVSIEAGPGSEIYIDGRPFRGKVDIIRKNNDRLAAINHIGLEDYLYGVLYHEVSHRWPMEALKSQAIVARTFAIYQAGQNKFQDYDLRSDIYSQVYGGKASEKWSTTRAVDLTRGKALVYNGAILPAYYHAACAGHTEDASNLWNVDMAPLKGVGCIYCKGCRHYRWVKEIPLKDIEEKLRANGHKIGGVVHVSVLSRNRSDRVNSLEIKDGAGASVVLTGKDFRQMMGPNEVRSTKFDVSVKGGALLLNGFGWGHGVGMCQWGAYGLARRGKNAEEILKFYYPGAEIMTVKDVENPKSQIPNPK
jgi:stage II sporulation protein D